MKRKLLRSCLCAVLAVVMLTAGSGALACTSVYVGSDLTANGSTYFGRSEDIGSLYDKVFEIRPAADHEPGELMEDYYGFSMPYPEHTYRYTIVRDPLDYGDNVVDDDGNIILEAYAEAGINENGVSVCATVSTEYNPIIDEVDPAVDGGLCEVSLATVILQSATSARDGVEILAAVFDEYGAGDDYGYFNSVLIGDADEVWNFQGVSGHEYVAVRLPADRISVNPNMVVMGEVDVSDTENVVASAGLISLALENGFLVSPQYDAETYQAGDVITKINVRDTYGTDDGAGQYTRYWQGVNYFNPALAATFTDEVVDYSEVYYSSYYPDYVTWYYSQYYPEDYVWDGDWPDPADYGLEMIESSDNGGSVYYTFQPELSQRGQITTFDVLRSLAERGEGTALDSNADEDIYPIGNDRQAECHIFEVRQNMPEELATIEWLTMDRAEYGLYLPFYSAIITDTSALYKSEFTLGDDDDVLELVLSDDSPVDGSLYWATACLNYLCSLDRDRYGVNVRESLDSYQQALIDQQAEVDAMMTALYAKDPAQASETATELGMKLAREAYVYLRDMVNELAAFIVEHEEDGEVFTPSALTEGTAPHYAPSTGAIPASVLFDDVEKDSWYESGVTYVADLGLFNGVADAVFAPDGTMTRAMLMTVLARMDGQDTEGGEPWYEKGMSWAVETGVSDGSAPEANITREQLATMLYRYAGSPAVPNLVLEFSDADEISDWADSAVRWCVGKGILTGDENGMLNPTDSATRAQAAAMLARYCIAD